MAYQEPLTRWDVLFIIKYSHVPKETEHGKSSHTEHVAYLNCQVQAPYRESYAQDSVVLGILEAAVEQAAKESEAYQEMLTQGAEPERFSWEIMAADADEPVIEE